MAKQEIVEIETRGKKYALIGSRWHVWAAARGTSTSTDMRWCAVPFTGYKLLAELNEKAKELGKAAA